MATQWGGAGENIDMRSGNMNFTLPLLQLQGRAFQAGVSLSYNSQIWRRDGTDVRRLGRDAGYGLGWKVQAGSIVPYWKDYYTIQHWIFTDATGAEYRLDQQSGAFWTSKESTWVTYDYLNQRLNFNDGSFWNMHVWSHGAEDDGGVQYPYLMQDSNGNQIWFRYRTGLYAPTGNSSGRIAEIEDVRAVSGKTYTFAYQTVGGVERLSAISNNIGSGESYTFTYSDQGLTSPFAGAQSFGTYRRLDSVQKTEHSQTYSFAYNGSGEMTSATLPYGGKLEWDYRDFTYAGSRTLREVQNRRVKKDGVNAAQYQLIHDDAGDAGRSFHSYTAVLDPGAAGDTEKGEKRFHFETATGLFNTGLLKKMESRNWVGNVVVAQDDYTWVQDGVLRPYIGAVTTQMDLNTANPVTSKVEQTLDTWGNMIQRKVFGYTSLTTPVETYAVTIATTQALVDRFIRNRPVSVQTPAGTTTYVYDDYSGTNELVEPTGLTQHDSGNFGKTFTVRGNATSVTAPGMPVQKTKFDITGMVAESKQDGTGHSVSMTLANNNAVPQTITPSGDTTKNVTMTWNSFLGMTGVSGPNGASVTTGFSSGRPTSKTSPHGATTTYGYSNTAPHMTETTNGRWTKTTLDGFGRPVKVTSGYGSGTGTTISIAETVYEPCGCTPMGKARKVSEPYAPGQTPIWAEYVYDALGRSKSVKQPNGNGTSLYQYEGNRVTTTDPAGRWKRFTSDALGNLTKVEEPKDLNATPQTSGNWETTYTYDGRRQLTGVSMVRGGVTQIRTFAYNSAGKMTSSVNPENGTTTYTYNADQTLFSQESAGARIEYEYVDHKRVREIRRYEWKNGVWQQDTSQTTTLYWDSAPFAEGVLTQGRLAGVQTNQLGMWKESFNYSVSGLVTKKKLMLTLPGLGAERTLQSTYGYNNEGQMTSMTYPTVANSTGRTLTTGLDAMARPVSMSDNQNEVTVNSVGYNHRSQMTSMSGPAGTVGWGFNELGQLTSMSAAGITETYSYAPGANNGRIVKKVTNGEEVVYQYDAVNRLIQSTVQGVPVETYSHDGFGNLVGRTGPNQISLPINPATNKFFGAGEHDARGNFVANGTYQYDLENRLAIANRTLDQGNDLYAYGHGNKRIYKRVEQDGQANKHYVFLYGAGGERIGHYEVTSTSVVRLTEWYYFAGRQVAESTGTILGVVTDRLGNVRKRGSATLDYYPYGQEKPGPTGNEVAKFGTYFRDAGTGLDYADQRHYSATYGRFMSPDPYQASGGPGDPGSWNRYAYVGGDPINFRDRRGLEREAPDNGNEIIYCPFLGTTVPRENCPKGGYQGDEGGPYCNQIGPNFCNGTPPPAQSCHRTWDTAPLEDDEWTDFADEVMTPEERAEIASQSPSAKGEREAVPALVALTAAEWVIYWARTPSGQYYIGVTSNFVARSAQHINSGRFNEVRQLLSHGRMDYFSAKALEQAYIEMGGVGGGPGALANRINSIATRNPLYQAAKSWAATRLDELRECGAALAPWAK